MDKLEKIKAWEQNEGITLMRKLGFKENEKVLDFGSNIGHYAFPLAAVVGRLGQIIAYDQNENALKIIETYKQQAHIHNIQTMLSHSNTEIPLPDLSLDGILFFDILHHLKDHQTQLIQESYRLLKNEGRLLILPFHYSESELQDLIQEIKDIGFPKKIVFNNAGLHFEHYKNKVSKDLPLSYAEKGPIYVFYKS